MKKSVILTAAALILGSAACGDDSSSSEAGTATAPGGTGEEEAAEAEEELTPVSIFAPSPSLNSAPLLAMVLNDYGRANGLDIDYTGAGASSTNIVAAVQAGEYDFGAPSYLTVFDAVNQGTELMVVGASVGVASTLMATDEVFEDAGITPDSPFEERVDALRGKTVVTSPVGSGSSMILHSILEANGIDADEDIDLVHVNETPAMVAGVRQGRFDAAFYGSGVLEILAVEDVGDVLFLAAEEPVMSEQLLLGLMTSKEYADANPEIVEKLYQSLADALEAIHDDPDQFYEPLQESYFADLDPEAFNLAWDNAAPDYPEEPTYTVAAFEAVLEQQEIATGNDYSGLSYEDIVHPVAQE